MSREWDEYVKAGTVADLLSALRALVAADPVAAGYRVSLAGCDCYGPWERGTAQVDDETRTVLLERRDEADVSRDNREAGGTG